MVVAALVAALLSDPVPYNWQNVEMVGGGFVTGVINHPTAKGLVYARTDIGGAYRFDDKTQRWLPLQDWITRPDWNLYGVESLALDPTDPQKVYIAAGTYTNEWGNAGAVLRSNDQGKTWHRTDLPFKNGGNMDGRSIGERLVVDPSQPRKLLFGTRLNGLWESLDAGATWHALASWPGKKGSSVGVGWVQFVSGGEKLGTPTKTVLAAEADPSRQIWISRDAGTTWKALAGQPQGLVSHHVAQSGEELLLTFSDHPGPNGATSGQVWAYNVAKNTWREVTPEKPAPGNTFGYAGATVGPDGAWMVSSLDRWSKHDTVWRSLDRGKTWRSLADTSQRDASNAKYLEWHRGSTEFGHWIGDVEIDPQNPDQAWYVTGATIWRTRDLRSADKGQATHWVPAAEGLEETAVIDLASPPTGAHVLSALGDINGFAHFDLAQSPTTGMFDNPLNSTTDDVDYSGLEPNKVVRVGRGGSGAHVGLSLDGGRTWQSGLTDPEAVGSGGTIAIDGYGLTIVFAPNRGPAQVSADGGKSWKKVGGVPDGAKVVSDKVGQRYYFIDAKERRLWTYAAGQKPAEPTRAKLPPDMGKAQARWSAYGEIWIPSKSGLFVSRDGGDSFSETKGHIVAEQVGLGKEFGPDRPPTLFVIGEYEGKHGVWRSLTSGDTWQLINDAATGYGTMQVIEGDPKKFGRVYIGTNGRGIVYGDPK